MTTPFPFETIASADSFYGRELEKKELLSHIENSTNVLLFSKRRMGKSTLIKNVFSEVKKDTLTIYIDIFNIITAQDFGVLLLKGVTSTQKGDVLKSIQKITKLFSRVRVEPTYDAISGKMSIKPVVSNLTFDEMMEDSFTALNELSKDKNIVLAIDEFQEISTIKDVKIDATLRKYMQESKNISFIFSGSKRNTLNSLFQYKSPLYSMATPFSLKAIDSKSIYTYAKKHLQISQEMTDEIVKLSDGETKLIQMILHRLYVENKFTKVIEIEDIQKVLSSIIVTKNDHFKSLFELLSTNQKKAFKLLAKHKKELFSNAILREENILRASMQSSLKQLFAKEYIDKEDGAYFIPDRTFELWGERVL